MEKKEKVLFIHNTYQHRGGEDVVVEDEVSLLESYGHEVNVYKMSNDEIPLMGNIELLKKTIWSKKTYKEVSKIIVDKKPDICHVHNTFPIISPSVYWAASEKSIPVIQTLHNFRLACPQAMFLRNSKICEDCCGKIPWRGVIRGCYRESIKHTAVLAGMVTIHRFMGTWSNKIDTYIALNEFCRDKFIESGLPKEKIRIKPNFIDKISTAEKTRENFLFVGRLSQEKGIKTLIEASNNKNLPKIIVAGSGPEENLVKRSNNIKYIGQIEKKEILHLMEESIAIIMPSIWYENFPKTVVEAMSCGTPIIASRIGALESIITDGYNGLLFEPGNAKELEEKILYLKSNPAEVQRISKNSLSTYEKLYSKEINYGQIMSIYRDTIKNYRPQHK